jgi:hypothetical protein
MAANFASRFRLNQILCLLGLALLAGCSAETDRNIYFPDEPGRATFRNRSSDTAWLGGCNPFLHERWDGTRWVSEGGEITCVWEGLAKPVPKLRKRIDPLTARAPGTWRLAYAVGLDCHPDEPLQSESCGPIGTVYSNTFTVAEPDDHEAYCHVTGGFWDLTSCGDYLCGNAPICLAVIPGCDCGTASNFVPGEGCVADATCDEVNAGGLCVTTGGTWDPTSCGHYSCGERPECTAVIPGCDCGPNSVFDEVFGCLAVPCGAPQ